MPGAEDIFRRRSAVAIPAKYNVNSELIRDVGADSNELNFDLQSK